MPSKKLNRKLLKHQTAPWTFRPDAVTMAIWGDVIASHPSQNASEIINTAIQLHAAESTRLHLLEQKAKIEAELSLLSAKSAKVQFAAARNVSR
jgi:hypothetical protein